MCRCRDLNQPWLVWGGETTTRSSAAAIAIEQRAAGKQAALPAGSRQLSVQQTHVPLRESIQPTVAGLGGEAAVPSPVMAHNNSDEQTGQPGLPEAASSLQLDSVITLWKGVVMMVEKKMEYREGYVYTTVSSLLMKLMNLLDYIRRLFIKVVETLQKIFLSVVKFNRMQSNTALPGQTDVESPRVIFNQPRVTYDYESAVVVASASPIKGGPGDKTWMAFYRKKLDPDVRGHAKYKKWLMKIFCTAEAGSDWRIFFDEEEKDPDSPWQVVIREARTSQKKCEP